MTSLIALDKFEVLFPADSLAKVLTSSNERRPFFDEGFIKLRSIFSSRARRRTFDGADIELTDFDKFFKN